MEGGLPQPDEAASCSLPSSAHKRGSHAAHAHSQCSGPPPRPVAPDASCAHLTNPHCSFRLAREIGPRQSWSPLPIRPGGGGVSRGRPGGVEMGGQARAQILIGNRWAGFGASVFSGGGFGSGWMDGWMSSSLTHTPEPSRTDGHTPSDVPGAAEWMGVCGQPSSLNSSLPPSLASHRERS